MKANFTRWMICIVLIIIVNSRGILAQPSITNLTNTSYTEAGSPVYVGPGVTVGSGGTYGGGYLLFDLLNPDTKDQLNLVSDASPNALGAISIVGSTLYLGNGSGADAIGMRDAILNGQNGQDLKFNFTSGDFDFEDGFPGWTIFDGFVDLGVNSIAGWPTPNDPNDNDVPSSASYWHDQSTVHNPPGSYSLHMESDMTTQFGCDIVHGPYAYSPSFTSSAGDVLYFDWQAIGGSDDYDVKGYILNVNTGAISMALSSTGGSTSWSTASVAIPVNGTYCFVFVSGTHDLSCGRAAGASLYIDNIKVLGTKANDAVLQNIIRKVTYQNDCGTSKTTRNLTISANNASSTGSASSTIALNTFAPVANCKNITVYLDISGQVTILGSDLNNGSTDDCPLTYIPSQATFTCINTGANSVVLTVMDSYGNTSTCNATVTVVDNLNPTIVCPVNIVRNTNTACTATGVVLLAPTTNDNCGVASVTNNHASTTYPIGITTVTWIVTDNAGLTATCSQLVTVNDNVNPTITCAPTVFAVTNTGCTASGIVLTTPVTGDNCHVASLTNNHPSGIYPLGNTTVIWTVTDDAGNTATCNQTVTVTDDVLPVIFCSPAVVRGTNTACTATGVVLAPPFFFDNCSATISNNHLLPSPTTYNLGTTTVIWTAVDGSGNTATCNQLVTVIDTVKPIIVCAIPAASYNTNVGGCTYTVPGTALDPTTATDNCTVASVVNDKTGTATLQGAIFSIGNTTVIWMITDLAGNTSTCSQIIRVVDNIFPTISCVTTFAVTNTGCTASGVVLTTPVTGDNCHVASLTNNHPSGIYPLGNTTVIWTVTDDAGNTATCNQTVTVTDDVLPVISCSAAVVRGTNTACTATGVVLAPPFFFDNCSATISNNHLLPSPTTYNLGTTTVIWTAVDGSGNTATCNQLVTVIDTVKPIIVCAIPAASYNTNVGGCTYTVPGTALDPTTTTDNCTVASIVNDKTGTATLQGAIFSIGNTTVIWSITDLAGNTSTCSQIIIVVDNINPTISCVSTFAVTNAGCTASGVILTTPTTGDNCHVASLTNNHPSGIYPLGNTTVIWTVTDDAGNTATCNQTVTVTDDVLPVIFCSPAVVRGTNTACTATGVVLAPPFFFDNCSATISNNHLLPSPTTYNLGTTTVIWTAVDGSGNTATCNQLVTVIDTVKPIIVCAIPAASYNTNIGGCTYTVPGTALDPTTATDNCTVASVVNDKTGTATLQGAIFSIGNTTVIWMITDLAGNTSTCSQIIKVVDNINPTISCVSTFAVTNADCTASGVILTTPSAGDNCHVASLTNNHPSGIYPLGNTTVIWTVTDDAGNTATCNQTVTVTDNVLPVIFCSPAVVRGTNTACTATGVVLAPPFFFDNCSATISNNHLLPSPTTYNLGTTTVIWTAIDGSGNTATCTQLVTVIDTVKPTIICPANIVTTTDTACTATGVVLLAPTTNDNCGVASVTNDHASTIYPLGTTTVTWTVTDNAGLTATCSQLVTVNDNIVPTISCIPKTVFTNTSCTATDVVLGTPVTGDNCSVVSVTNNHASQTYPLGNTTVTWTVTDGSGNTATTTQLVTVLDNVNPAIICPASVVTGTNASCTATGVVIGNPVTSDNCSIASVTNNHVSTTYPLGNTTVIWTVIDGSGNTATCNQLVTVIDTVKPIIVCAIPAASYNTNIGGCTYTIPGTALDPTTATDNCTVASIVNDKTGTATLQGAVFSIGNTTVIWSITDLAGNTSTCSQIIIVVDNIIPTISCVTTFAVTNTGCTASGVVLTTPVTGDNCHVASLTNNHSSGIYPLGNTTVIWTVTDDAGNTATCNQTVTVTDNVLPVIFCSPAVVRGTNTACTATGVVLAPPFFFDNCSATISNNHLLPSPTTYNLGTTTVKWTVVDGSGNTATCNQLVTVIDTVKPTIICPTNIVTTTNTACTATGVVLLAPTTNDNCGVASVTNDHASTAYPLGTTTVTWTVTDNAGLTATCSQLVTVNDNIVPTISCIPKTVFTNTSCTATDVVLGTPVTGDNCSVVSVTNNHASQTYPLGNTTVTWTVTDGSGNTATTTQLVTVIDNLNPTIICPASVVTGTNASCTATGVVIGDPVTADNCSIASVTNNHVSTTYPLGNTTVIWTVIDGSGNTATCNQIVTVIDNINPTISCPTNVVTPTTSGCIATGVVLGTPISADNCSISSITNNAPAIYPLGYTTIEWTIIDDAGNINTCDQLVMRIKG